MASPLQLNHPFQSRLAALEQLPAGFRVTTDPYRTMTNVHLPHDGLDHGLEAVTAVIGVRPPTTPNTWAGDERAAVIWLGPHEWLVTADIDNLPTQEQSLRAALMPIGGAAVDVSGQRVTLRLTGDHLRDVLAKGCPIDLHRATFRPGACAQTLMGRAGVVLLADADQEAFTILVRQSFATYLADWLCDAALEFTSTPSSARCAD